MSIDEQNLGGLWIKLWKLHNYPSYNLVWISQWSYMKCYLTHLWNFFHLHGLFKASTTCKTTFDWKKVILWQKNSIDFVRLMSTVINHKPIVWSVCNFSPDFLCLLFTGILVAKKNLFVNPVPSGCGGGSVFFVSAKSF